MLTMRDHDVADYAALRDMDATDVRELHDDDRACLDELGEYLTGTDAWRRFAIWLLHKHFEPGHGEVFVERVTAEPRGTETGPVGGTARAAAELHATSVRFDPAVSADVAVVGMEFASPADFGATPPLSAADETVLAGIAARLQARGKIERFGVRLIRNPLGLAEQEMLLETCDKARRTLYCEVGDGSRAPKAVETTWQWMPGPDNGKPTHKCLIGCEPWTDGEHTTTRQEH